MIRLEGQFNVFNFLSLGGVGDVYMAIKGLNNCWVRVFAFFMLFKCVNVFPVSAVGG